MKKIIIGFVCAIVVVLIFTIADGVKNDSSSNFSTHEMAIRDDITEFEVEVDSEEQAFDVIEMWLMNNTDFTRENNEIVTVEQLNDYFEIRLEKAVTIHGRVDGIMGYRDYVITRDGELKGYYMLK